MKPFVALLSGGLDSAVSLMLSRSVEEAACAITFDYGQRAAGREIEAASFLAFKLGIPHEIIPLPWLASATKTALVNRGVDIPETSIEELSCNPKARAASVWVPNRNGLFIAIAASIAESRNLRGIVAGFNAEEAVSFPDNSAGFVEASNRALSFSTMSSVSLFCPVISLSKEEIAAKAIELDLDPSSFWCCYEGGELMCGRCESCARTMRAFQEIGAWGKVRERFNLRANRPGQGGDPR